MIEPSGPPDGPNEPPQPPPPPSAAAMAEQVEPSRDKSQVWSVKVGVMDKIALLKQQIAEAKARKFPCKNCLYELSNTASFVYINILILINYLIT